jgi:DNA polymerase
MIATIDFETYSEAGYNWCPDSNRWVSIVDTAPHSIGAVGAPVYAEHPSTDVLCMAYDLGNGPQLWIPESPWPPTDLFEHIAAGGLVEAHNSMFEYLIWNMVCCRRYGWPALPLHQLRCSAAKARASSIPGKLAKAAEVLGVTAKIAEGARLIQKFSVPHNPSKKDPRRRVLLSEEPQDAALLYQYCLGDIKTEAEVSAAVAPLSDTELEVWLVDQNINTRGIAVDRVALADCICIVDQAHEKYTRELWEITGGAVSSPNEVKRMGEWLHGQGVHTGTLDAEAVEAMLASEMLPPVPRRVLEIRAMLASSSVKKLYAIDRRVSCDGRLRDLFQYAGALHTRRWSGKGPQPQNLTPSLRNGEEEEGTAAVEEALSFISKGSLSLIEEHYGNPISVVSGCLRGLFCAGPGFDLICSDYKAIEAVVLAELAGEAWRQQVFQTHGLIYEMSAAKITGVPFIDFITYKKEHNGESHPLRKSIGKVAELASGYQGALGAWKNFGADKHLTDDEIKAAVAAWRRESPNIVKFWYAMEDCARAAIQNPGQCFGYRGIDFGVRNDILHIKLLSGRLLNYHAPRLTPSVTDWGKHYEKISFMGWNSDFKKGPPGWMRLDTYGGCLTENVTQATARDILAHALVGLERAGYRPVLHVHDEPCGEVPEGWGSVEEFEKIMTTLPEWCRGWPIKATGGWRGKRYRKD